MGDAEVLWKFFKKITGQFNGETLVQYVNEIMKHPSTPLAIPYDVLDNLPEGPGVYIFYGDGKTPLYVGKSINIHDRVLDHLSSSYGTDLKLAQAAREIKHIETAGELSALLLESRMIKDMHPMYNKLERYAYKLIGLKKVKDKNGYLTVKFCDISGITVEELTDIAGVFKSQKHVKRFLKDIVDGYNLCPKLLGIEKLGRNCFNHRLGKCRGACSGLEKPASYNMRFVEAFFKNSIKNWPFKGAIIIREKEEIEEHHLFDKWCYLGTMTESGFEKKDYCFDYDTYRIISRYVLDHRNWSNIREIDRKVIKNTTVSDYFL